jgi:hypothetical protein
MLGGGTIVMCAVSCSTTAHVNATSDKAQPSTGEIASSVSHSASQDLALKDDLSWLVGRWRCYVRQYTSGVSNTNGPLGSGAEDMLDYLNVYYPFADDRLTISLTSNPEDRAIAAEFLIRQIVSDWPSLRGDLPTYTDRLAPMSPWGAVKISKDCIRVGSYPGDYLDFKYRVETNGLDLWLVLESNCMYLKLHKFTPNAGDIKKSFVKAPLKDFTAERILGLTREYQKLGVNGSPKR